MVVFSRNPKSNHPTRCHLLISSHLRTDASTANRALSSLRVPKAAVATSLRLTIPQKTAIQTTRIIIIAMTTIKTAGSSIRTPHRPTSTTGPSRASTLAHSTKAWHRSKRLSTKYSSSSLHPLPGGSSRCRRIMRRKSTSRMTISADRCMWSRSVV